MARTLPTRIALTTLVALLAPLPGQPDAALAAWKTSVSTLRADLTEQGVVGASLLLLRGVETLAREHHGFADLATRRKVDGDTIFHWASVTKTLTGIATAQLAHHGKLSLDDRIVDHIPTLRRVHAGDFDLEAITLGILLQHAAGFRENTFPWGGARWQPYEPGDWAQLEAMFPYTRLHFAPGSKFRYSNPGLVFVGQAIERVAGEDYEVYVDKNILKPLGMHRSFFDNTPYHLRPYRSNNYSVVDGEHRAHGLDLDTGITVSNGGLNAPLSDMARYLRFLLGAGDSRVHDLVLDRKTLAALWTPTREAGEQGGWQRSMATSFFLYRRDGRTVVGHTGSQRGFQCFFLIEPKQGTGVLAAFNSASKSQDPKFATRQIMFRFMEALLDRVLPKFGS